MGIFRIAAYAVSEPPFKKGRLSGHGVIHMETYRRLTDDEREEVLAAYDDYDRHLGLVHDWTRQGLSHYLDWFYTKWSRHPDTKPFIALLQKTGFMSGEDE